MTPREMVIEQIAHRPTRPVPFTLGFEGEYRVSNLLFSIIRPEHCSS
jgi:hypothetical protein